MKSSTTRTRLLASSMITGATLLAAGGAFAQTADSGTSVGEVVVTGSRIPHPNLTTATPVTTVTAQSIKLQGTVNVEDFINNLPQAFADQGQYVSNGSTGTAAVDLRGLGAKRTLVMIDGARLQPGDPTDPVPDINFIPPALIDHVDVVTGGASAVYGSDAVSGVVNFIMKKNFTGLQIDAESSVAEYDGSSGQINQANQNGAGLLGINPISLPTKTEWDGQRDTVTITGGVNSPDDKGNVEFYFGKTTILPVNESKRNYSACSLATNSGNYEQYCGGSPTSNFVDFQPNSTTTALGGVVAKPPADPLLGRGYLIMPGGVVSQADPFTFGSAFNYAPYNYFQRPDTRYTAGQFSTYNINSHFNLYSSFMFLDDHTVAAIAPSGSFFGGNTYTIPCNDPLLSSSEQTAICGTNAGVAGDSNTAGLAHRNVEGGPRTSDLEHVDYRIVVGSKGEIADGWTYNLSAQYGRSLLTDVEGGYFLNSHLINALNVIPNPAAGAIVPAGQTTNVASLPVGAPVCASAAAVKLGCTPYNVFGFVPGGPSAASLQYLTGVAINTGSTTEQVATFTISNDLTRYGLKSPWANKGWGFSAGVEYRSENLQTNYDATIQSNDLAGAGGSIQNTSGTQSDKDAFAELSIPIIEDMPFAKALTFDTAYRYSDYSSGGGNSTYKFSLDWQIEADVALRGSYERAVRAPNVQELFLPSTPGLFAGQDPCAGATPGLSPTQCYNTITHSDPTMTLAQFTANVYGNISKCPASQCGVFAGGNSSLHPETADTFSYGVVFTPTFFRGFSLTVDYFNIKVDQAIINLSGDTLLYNCATTANAFDCSKIDRLIQGNGDDNIYGDNGVGNVNEVLLNASSLKTSGVDVEAQYHFRLADFGAPDLGSLTFLFNGTWLHDLTTVLPDGTQYDCSGLYGVTCGTPSPHWRHQFRVTWNTPWNLTLSAQWRYIGGSALDFNQSNPDFRDGSFHDTLGTDANIPAYSYFDASFTYKFKDRYTIRGGVNNVFDKIPPLLDSNSFGISAPPFGNGNTYPQVYDPLGRVLFLGITADF